MSCHIILYRLESSRVVCITITINTTITTNIKQNPKTRLLINPHGTALPVRNNRSLSSTHPRTNYHTIFTYPGIASYRNTSKRRQRIPTIRTNKPIPHPALETSGVENMPTRRDHVQAALENHARRSDTTSTTATRVRGTSRHDGDYNVHGADAAVENAGVRGFIPRLARSAAREVCVGGGCGG